MAYNEFYGFRENPFNQTPDSDFFFASDHHKNALDAMLYAIRQRKGFVVVTGEIGSGKTTVTRMLLRKLDSNVRTAVITNTHLSPKGVITLILEDLGVPYNKNGSKEKLIVQLNEYLLRQIEDDKNTVLIIDEAQNLSAACLEEVRMLSNLETEKEKLIQIILIGQPELRSKLELPQLKQLRTRIAIQLHLNPLSQEDTVNYVYHRLNKAKLNGRDYANLFEEKALEHIFKYSKGIPRMINSLCDHSLLSAFVSDSQQVTESIVLETVEYVGKTN